MKKSLLIALLLVVTLFFQNNCRLLAQTNNSQYASKAVEEISIIPAHINDNCKLTNTFYVDISALKQFEKKFGVKLLSLKNDVFTDDENKTQINYIETTGSGDTKKLYKKLVKQVGNSNVVASKGNVVVEIISPSIEMKKKILSTLKPDEVHTNY
ncbi:MAG: hypothetical protein AB1782_03365 [Cyanobacteriota bacterium]